MINRNILDNLTYEEKNIIKIDLITSLEKSLLEDDNKDIDKLISDSLDYSLKAIYILRR